MQQVKHYGATAKWLHWGIVILAAVQFITAWTAPEVRGSTTPADQISIHMSFGIIIIAVMLVRLVWRLFNPAPELPAHFSPFAKLSTFAGHWVLYGLLFLTPLTGWALASAHGWQPTMFGLYTVPPIFTGQSAHTIGVLHGAFASLTLLIVLGHFGMALYHKFADNDGIWERMLPKFLVGETV